jgi:hypothetical protein
MESGVRGRVQQPINSRDGESRPFYKGHKMEIKEISRKTRIKGDPVQTEEMVKKMKKEHSKLVKGMFEFVDAQGGYLDFAYRIFKDDPLMTLRLNHGEICELPMGIVKHLNNCVKKIRVMQPMGEKSNGTRGIPSTVMKQSRVRFTPMDMM